METILGRNVLHETKHFRIEGVDIDFGNSKQAQFEMVVFNDTEPTPGAIICGYDSNTQEIIMIEQFQVALGARALLLPRGGQKSGKTLLESAQEEFLEETGFEAKQRIELHKIYASPGFFSQHTGVFLAFNIFMSNTTLVGDEIEETFACRIGLNEAIQKIMNGDIVDARTICGIFMMKEYLASS